MAKYILLDYEGKWKNDVFRMFYHMTNFFIKEFGYILIDTSSYNSSNKTLLQSVLHTKDTKDTQDFQKDTIVELQKDAVLPDRNQKDKILVIENHDGKLLPEIFTDIEIMRDKVEFFLLSDDIHKEKDKKIQLHYYDYFKKIFVNYYNPFFEQYHEFFSESQKNKDKIVWIPHCVPDSMMISFNKNPINKIGLLGNTAGKIYPNRAYLKELAARDPLITNKVAEKAHPSKKYKAVDYEKSTNLVGQTYFNTLNQFLCNFTCSLTLGYTVCKYFEIAYTGSLLLCDSTHDDLAKLGFIDMETCIIYRNQAEIKEKILWILDPLNKAKVDRIRKAGMELVINRHMVSIRCKEIDELIRI